jgi:parallel beta-helix repeat protein
MSKVLVGVLLLACLVVLNLIPATPAAEGRTPVFAPTVITTNGRYIVTRNIVGTGAGPVIDIATDNVDLDLNGFLLTEPAGAFPVILISGPTRQVTIHDGTLALGSAGIEAPAPGEKLVVEGVKSQGAGGAGIHNVDIQTIVIRRSVVEGSGGTGILIDGGAIHSGAIENNVLQDVGGDGIFFNSGSVGILNNRIARSGGTGISLFNSAGSLVSENTIVDAAGDGLLVRSGKGNKLFDNVVRGNGINGIHLDPATSDTLVLNNVSAGNGSAVGGHGLLVEGDQNLIERNTLNSNTGAGLFFPAIGCQNTFGRNMARGNGGVGLPACGGVPALFPPNSCNVCPGATANSTFGDNLIPGPPIF